MKKPRCHGVCFYRLFVISAFCAQHFAIARIVAVVVVVIFTGCLLFAQIILQNFTTIHGAQCTIHINYSGTLFGDRQERKREKSRK